MFEISSTCKLEVRFLKLGQEFDKLELGFYNLIKS